MYRPFITPFVRSLSRADTAAGSFAIPLHGTPNVLAAVTLSMVSV